MEKWARFHLILSALLLLTAAIYAPALSGGFVYDDHLQVEQNVFIRSLKNLPEFFRHSTGYFQHPEGSQKPGYYYRPLHLAAYAVIHAWGGRSPMPYHAVNILLAGLAAFMVFWVGSKLLPFWAALLAAVWFAVLPVHAEPVVWIAALPEMLSTLFFLCAFNLHVKLFWKSRDYALSGLCLLAAFLTRENTLVFPVLALAYDAMPWGRKDALFSKNGLRRYAVYGLAVVAYFWLRSRALGFVLTDGHAGYPLTTGEILLNLMPLSVRYFSAFAVPPPVSAFHILHPVSTILDPRSWGAGAGLLALLALGLWLYRRDRAAFFFYLWMPVTLLPFFYLPGLGENIFTERYMFLPSVGFCLLAGYGFVKLFSRLATGWARATAALLALSLAAWWAGSSVARGYYWQDDIVLAEQTLKNDPQAFHFVNIMGYAYYLRGDLGKARTAFASLENRFPGPRGERASLPVTYQEVGALPRRWNGYQQSFFEAQTQLAALDYQQGRLAPALARYEKLAAVFSGDAGLLFYQGLCCEQLGRLPEAMAAYRRVLYLDPNHGQARLRSEALLGPLASETERLCSRAKVFIENQRFAAALSLLQTAARKDPFSARPWHYLFNLYWLTGQKEKAEAAMREALRREPDNPLFNYNYRALTGIR